MPESAIALTNAEIFSQQISTIEDRVTMLEIKKALENVKNLYNNIRVFGHYKLLEKMDFAKLNHLYNEAARHLELLNLKEAVKKNPEATDLVNVALENVIFMFRKIDESELVLADQLKDILRKTRESLGNNIDKKDPDYVLLYEELKRLFENNNLGEITQEEMTDHIKLLHKIHDRVKRLNQKNNQLRDKYNKDKKYLRVHKRILEMGKVSKKETEIFKVLTSIKTQVDEKVLINNQLLNNESYFEQLMIVNVIRTFDEAKIKLDVESSKFIGNLLMKEYIKEFQGLDI
jgi:type I restriction enzyme R subunit